MHLEKARALYDPADHPRYRFQYGQDIGATALCYLTWAQWHLGDYETALETAETAMKQVRSLGHPLTSAYTMCHAMGMIDVFRGRPEAAHGCAQDIVDLCEQHGLPFWAAGGRVLAGWANIHLGNPEGGIQQFRSGLKAWRGSGARIWVPYFLALEAEALAGTGHLDRALSTIDEALAVASQTGERWSSAELLRTKAGILQGRNPPDTAEAESLLTEGLEIARAQGGRFWQARVAADLARLWQGSGREDAARELLSLQDNAPPDHGAMATAAFVSDVRD